MSAERPLRRHLLYLVSGNLFSLGFSSGLKVINQLNHFCKEIIIFNLIIRSICSIYVFLRRLAITTTTTTGQVY